MSRSPLIHRLCHVVKRGTKYLPCLLLIVSYPATAADWSVRVTDSTGDAVPNAIVALQSDAFPEPGRLSAEAIDLVQENQQFSPSVIAVQVGTVVRFINYDRTRHHVYSFSPAKTFETRLYGDTEAPEVTFDRVGVVALGCNIHDWMKSYIYVSATPYFSVTGASGIAHFSAPTTADIAGMSGVLTVWHPSLEKALTVQVALSAVDASVQLPVVAKPIQQQRPGDDPLAKLFDQARSRP